MMLRGMQCRFPVVPSAQKSCQKRKDLLKPMTFGLCGDPNDEVAPREIHSVREKAKKAKKGVILFIRWS
jgi:hypothetical protein